MALCLVVFEGMDRIDHEMKVEAASLFAAADLAMRQAIRKHWYDPAKPITVKHAEGEWKVLPERVKAWKAGADHRSPRWTTRWDEIPVIKL